MPTRDVIVVGASAGGVEALRAFVAGMPADLDAAIAVVLHLPAGGTSALAKILDRAGPLPAVTASHGMALRRGRVHVAPPDHHLLVIDGVAHLSHGPTENGHRPAVDALFRSAAATHGVGVVGVVLSGALDDGTAGMLAIAARGGLTVVQDPHEALYDGMPGSVLRHLQVDHVVSSAKMGALLRDCDGNLIELDATSERFRCHVGHARTAEALPDAQGVALEKAVWTALRTLEEKAGLARRMRDDASTRGADLLVRRFQRTEEEATHAADVLRRHLLSGTFDRPADGMGEETAT